MVDKRRDNRSSDDLLADLDALEELLGKKSGRDTPSLETGPQENKGQGLANTASDRRSEGPKETDVAKSSETNRRSRPQTGGSKPKEEQIPLLEDVVYPGTSGVKTESSPSRPRVPEPPPRLPTRAEIDSWVELAIETRLEPLKKQLRRELWEELMRRFPALRGRDQ